MTSEARYSVDIVMPVHNREDLLEETINSVRKQTYPYWKLFAVDDASSDGSLALLTEISKSEPRIEVSSVGDTSLGACRSRNIGFQNGSAPFVMFLDSDDLLSGDCLASRIASVEHRPDLDFILGNTLLFDVEPYDLGVLWNRASLNAETDFLRFLRQDMPWHTMGPLWRRASFLRLGGWNESLTAFQDWELHVRACFLKMRYEQAGSEPDSFYRRPQRDRVTIASAQMADERVAARFQAIRSVANLDGFRGSVEHTAYVEAFCLRNALQLLDAERKSAALTFLKTCIMNGLFRPLHAMAATAIVLRGPYWRGSRFARQLKRQFWSEECRVDPWQKVQCGV